MTMDLSYVQDVVHRMRMQQVEAAITRAIRRPGTFKGALMRSTSPDALRIGIPRMTGPQFANILTYAGRSLGFAQMQPRG